VEDVHLSFETNVYGVLRVIQAVLPAMREQGGGMIINVSSIAGAIGVPFHGLYSASKFALEGMTEALRMECRRSGCAYRSSPAICGRCAVKMERSRQAPLC
jgi:NADP-dependent 3-hydroxy acid dehydrogenase YdfG